MFPLRIGRWGGRAPPLWQLPATKGLERCRHRNGADPFVNLGAPVFSWLYRQRNAGVFRKSEMDSDQIKLNPGARLMPIRAGEGGGAVE